jgi:hypothetical protein
MRSVSRRDWNACRRPNEGGHYESWFLRANHPSKPQAFWIRYTMFIAADDRPSLGELWFIYFDEERDRPITRKAEVPLAECSFSADDLGATIDGATLDPSQLKGAIEDVRWDLRYEGDAEPLLLLPRRLYDGGFPKAKSVVPLPQATFSGTLHIGAETIEIDGWRGSQNHNWGSRHTDKYAWGQVAGFDDAPDVFLECATAKIRLGPIWTPWVTVVTVRMDGRTLAVNDLLRGARARAEVERERWSFETRRGDLRIRARFDVGPDGFVSLNYYNPSGGEKTCLNSKTAACELEIEQGGTTRRFATTNRAAFERLVDPC